MNADDRSIDDDKTIQWNKQTNQSNDRPKDSTEKSAEVWDDAKTIFQVRADPSMSAGLDDARTVFRPSTDRRRHAPLDSDEATTFQPIQSSTRLSQTETDGKNVRNATRDPVVGDSVLDGRFRLLQELKHGAQAFAFKAHDEVRNLLVFIKVSRHVDYEAGAFRREISLRDHLYSLTNRNLLKCLNVEIQGGRLIEVYEFLSGISLSEWIASKKSLTSDEIRSAILQLSNGIQALQTEGGLVHRDIKPDNIIVLPTIAFFPTKESFLLKIVDYGTACRIGAGGLTPVEGTRYYSPPECLSRHSANDQLLKSWDWWSLGRIAQQMIDGVDIATRLNQVRDVLSKGESQELSNQHLLDELLREQDVDRYHVRAGMVEISEKAPAAAPWVPLLRGLLTTRRTDRWGYAEVKQFMAGQAVRDRYSVPADADGFEFNNAFWELSQLALHLINESAKLDQDYLLVGKSPDGRKDIWEQAKDLVRGGAISRYIKDVLRNVDLDRSLDALLKINDRDLGTAVVLLRLAEILQPPAVKNRVVNRALLLHLATRPEPRAQEMFTTLLTPAYLAIHSALHPESGAELAMAAKDIATFRKYLVEVNVLSNYGGARFSDQSLLIHLSMSKDEATKAIDQFKVKLGRSENPRLEALFSKASDSLSTIEYGALLLALAEPATNRFVSNEAIASELVRRAHNIRVAAALLKGASILSTPFVLGSVKARIVGFLLAEAVIVFYLPDVYHQFLFNPVFWIAASTLSVAFGLAKPAFLKGFERDIRKLDPDLAATKNLNSKSLVNRAAQWSGSKESKSTSLYSELSSINVRLAKIPGFDASKVNVTRPSFPRTRLAQIMQLSVCAIFLVAIPVADTIVKIDSKLQVEAQQRDYERSHPKPLRIQDGRQLYRASDLNQLSQHGEKMFYLRTPLDLEGKILIVGDLTGARLRANQADMFIKGDIQSSEIKLVNGTVTAGSVSKGTGIIIDREGTVNIRDSSHSTIRARNIVVHNADNSSLVCERAIVTGLVPKGLLIERAWRRSR